MRASRPRGPCRRLRALWATVRRGRVGSGMLGSHSALLRARRGEGRDRSGARIRAAVRSVCSRRIPSRKKRKRKKRRIRLEVGRMWSLRPARMLRMTMRIADRLSWSRENERDRCSSYRLFLQHLVRGLASSRWTCRLPRLRQNDHSRVYHLPFLPLLRPTNGPSSSHCQVVPHLHLRRLTSNRSICHHLED